MPWWVAQFGEPQANGLHVLSLSNASLVTSILSVGTFFGALGAYPVGDALGRRYGIVVGLVLFAIGVALQTDGVTIAESAVRRVFAGFGVGVTSSMVPIRRCSSSEEAAAFSASSSSSCESPALIPSATLPLCATRSLTQRGRWREGWVGACA